MPGLMTRQQRAKQFQPFDAMKGLTEALRDREERHCREQKREISEEKIAEISSVLQRVQNGMVLFIEYFNAFHYFIIRGEVTIFNQAQKYLQIEEQKIFFEDIYNIKIIDY